MSINPSEVTKLLKDQIKNFGEKAEVSEIGKVLSVGDGIARVYGLDIVQAGEVIAFAGNSGELSTGYHLHFELWKDGKVINPSDYIKNLKLMKDEGTNVYDLFKYNNVVITSTSAKKLQSRILNEKNRSDY